MKKSMLALALATAAWAQAPNTKLFSKIYGCEAAVSIANAMGASVEGWTYERIEQTQNFRRTRTRCRAAPHGRPPKPHTRPA
jgi:hypothetical protein